MAEFCRDCALDMWGSEDSTDFKDISTEEDTEKGQFASVLCEGCGDILVDHTGKRVAKLTEREDGDFYWKACE